MDRTVIMKGILDGLKLLGLVAAVALVIWTMPEYNVPIR